MATAELDLTNNAREFAPAGTTVRANFSTSLQDLDLIYPDEWPDDDDGDNILNNTQRVINYYVEGSPNVGVGTVDAAGNYSMVVPALSEGLCMDMVFQSFQADVTQAVMFDETTGAQITPAFADLTRFFGPDADDPAIVQWIPGAWASFPAPPSQGAGFAMDVTVQGRDLGTWTQGSALNGPNDLVSSEDGFAQQQVMYRVSNAGAGFTTAAPSIAITGGGGTGASLIANMVGRITGINITNGGDYLTTDVPTIEVYVIINGDTFQLAVITVPAPGVDNTPITTGALDPATALISDGANVFSGGNGIDPGFTLGPDGGTGDFATYYIAGTAFNGVTFAQTGNFTNFPNSAGRITGIILRVTGSNGASNATATLTSTMEVDMLTMTGGGSGFTSAPTITATGGTTALTILVTRFATQYVLTVNNTGVTTPYVVLPDVEIFIQPFTAVPNTLVWTEDNDVTFTVLNTGQSHTDNINVKLVIDGSGNIQYYDQGYTYITELRSVGVPYVLVQDVFSTPASAWVDIDNEGHVTGLSINDFGEGYTTAFTVTISPTITGAPGSGGLIELLGFNVLATGEYQWGVNSPFYKVISGGQNYMMSLNFPFTDSPDYSFTRDDVNYTIYGIYGQFSDLPDPYDCITVFPGNTYQVDGFYGSGSLTPGKEQFPGF
jgi:hypothetical protein